MATVHIIGAGMSGLACAVRCALAGKQVAFYEAAPQAGGRARSFVDEGLGCMVDNGSHMLLGANRSTRDYLSDISSNARISEIKPATYPFLDVRTGESWLLRPAGGWLPHWLLNSSRRVPGSKIGDYAEALSLARAGAGDTVADCVDTTGVLYERLWQPMTRAVLNADAREGEIRVEMQSWDGTPVSGFEMGTCVPLGADAIAHRVCWDGEPDRSPLQGVPIRMRVEARNAALYSVWFPNGDTNQRHDRFREIACVNPMKDLQEPEERTYP